MCRRNAAYQLPPWGWPRRRRHIRVSMATRHEASPAGLPRANKFSPQPARTSIAMSRSILLCWCVRLHTAKLNTAKLNTAKLNTAKLNTAKLNTAKLNTAEVRALLNARRRRHAAPSRRKPAQKRPQTANERPTSEEREQRPRGGGGLRAACTLHVICRRRLHRTSRQPKRAPGCEPRGWWRHCCEGPAVDWRIVGGRGRGPPARQRLSEPPMQGGKARAYHSLPPLLVIFITTFTGFIKRRHGPLRERQRLGGLQEAILVQRPPGLGQPGPASEPQVPELVRRAGAAAARSRRSRRFGRCRRRPADCHRGVRAGAQEGARGHARRDADVLGHVADADPRGLGATTGSDRP
jgi:hypothetical protein